MSYSSTCLTDGSSYSSTCLTDGVVVLDAWCNRTSVGRCRKGAVGTGHPIRPGPRRRTGPAHRNTRYDGQPLGSAPPYEPRSDSPEPCSTSRRPSTSLCKGSGSCGSGAECRSGHGLGGRVSRGGSLSSGSGPCSGSVHSTSVAPPWPWMATTDSMPSQTVVVADHRKRRDVISGLPPTAARPAARTTLVRGDVGEQDRTSQCTRLLGRNVPISDIDERRSTSITSTSLWGWVHRSDAPRSLHDATSEEFVEARVGIRPGSADDPRAPDVDVGRVRADQGSKTCVPAPGRCAATRVSRLWISSIGTSSRAVTSLSKTSRVSRNCRSSSFGPIRRTSRSTG